MLVAGMVGGCAPRAPKVAIGSLIAGLDGFLGAHRLTAGQAIRVDEVDRTASASYHVVQARGSEAPHRHVAHDLSVLVLRGRGTLTLDGAPMALQAGDMVFVRRGTPHWFASQSGETAVALAIFTPPLDGPDNVPAGAPGGSR